MKAVQSNTKSPIIHEDENYWRQHIKSHQSSGLSRAKYCRVNHVNYDRFNYWIKRQRVNSLITKPSSLIPVQIKKVESQFQERDSVLCQLTLKNGSTLSIHHREALLLILERMM